MDTITSIVDDRGVLKWSLVSVQAIGFIGIIHFEHGLVQISQQDLEDIAVALLGLVVRQSSRGHPRDIITA